MTTVGFGNPYLKKEPVDTTVQPDALLTPDEAKSRTYWFLYDRTVGVAAMGVQYPQTDLTRLLCRFEDSAGFKKEMCESLRYVAVSSGKKPVSLSVKQVLLPPDISILPYSRLELLCFFATFDHAAQDLRHWNRQAVVRIVRGLS
jgi:hypothetical protein